MGGQTSNRISSDITLSLKEASSILMDGDVLLFRASTNPFSVGFWIGLYSFSIFSHVGLAYFHRGEWHVCEFREFQTSRLYPLAKYLAEGQKIDLFRVTPVWYKPLVRDGEVKEEPLHWYGFRREAMMTYAKSLMGKPYNWYSIWAFIKGYTPFIRLWSRKQNDFLTEGDSFICSSFVATCYRKFYADPVPYLRDDACSPGDLARSSLFRYICTLTK